MYRESEKKIVKFRIILTRGEVDQILRTKLAEQEKIPPRFAAPPQGAVGTMRSMAVLVDDQIKPPPKQANGNDANWADWPAYSFEWEEELPA